MFSICIHHASDKKIHILIIKSTKSRKVKGKTAVKEVLFIFNYFVFLFIDDRSMIDFLYNVNVYFVLIINKLMFIRQLSAVVNILLLNIGIKLKTEFLYLILKV